MSDALPNLYQKYFAALLALMDRSGIKLRTPRKPYAGQFQIIDSWRGKIDTAVNILKSKKKIRVDLTLKGNSANKQFLELEKDKHDVQEVVGKVKWEPQPVKERQIIAVLKADPTDERDWPRQHAWLAARLIAFRLAFGPRIDRF
jgi:hypothetical protein